MFYSEFHAGRFLWELGILIRRKIRLTLTLCSSIGKNVNSDLEKLPPELAPCGIFCGACPSFNKTCHGCSSEKEQNRKSKWACKVRTCCYSEKQNEFCFNCEEFPCRKHRKKLLDSHKGDPRYGYRHEIIDSFKKYSELGIELFLEFQNKKWLCPACKGRVHWYYYKCGQCGREYLSKDKE